MLRRVQTLVWDDSCQIWPGETLWPNSFQLCGSADNLVFSLFSMNWLCYELYWNSIRLNKYIIPFQFLYSRSSHVLHISEAFARSLVWTWPWASGRPGWAVQWSVSLWKNRTRYVFKAIYKQLLWKRFAFWMDARSTGILQQVWLSSSFAEFVPSVSVRFGGAALQFANCCRRRPSNRRPHHGSEGTLAGLYIEVSAWKFEAHVDVLQRFVDAPWRCGVGSTLLTAPVLTSITWLSTSTPFYGGVVGPSWAKIQTRYVADGNMPLRGWSQPSRRLTA